MHVEKTAFINVVILDDAFEKGYHMITMFFFTLIGYLDIYRSIIMLNTLSLDMGHI